MRMLLIFIALALIVAIAKRFIQDRRKQAAERRPEQGRMVQCAHCGTYVPEDEAVRGGEHWYCSVQHRDAGDADT